MFNCLLGIVLLHALSEYKLKYKVDRLLEICANQLSLSLIHIHL